MYGEVTTATPATPLFIRTLFVFPEWVTIWPFAACLCTVERSNDRTPVFPPRTLVGRVWDYGPIVSMKLLTYLVYIKHVFKLKVSVFQKETENGEWNEKTNLIITNSGDAIVTTSLTSQYTTELTNWAMILYFMYKYPCTACLTPY